MHICKSNSGTHIPQKSETITLFQITLYTYYIKFKVHSKMLKKKKTALVLSYVFLCFSFLFLPKLSLNIKAKDTRTQTHTHTTIE